MAPPLNRSGRGHTVPIETPRQPFQSPEPISGTRPGWVFCCLEEHVLKAPFDIAGDLDTPVSAFAKLGAFNPRFLLESVEGGERLARYSFIGFGEGLEVAHLGLEPLDHRDVVADLRELGGHPAGRVRVVPEVVTARVGLELLEPQIPEGAATTYDFAPYEWARRWPAEEVWKARKR